MATTSIQDLIAAKQKDIQAKKARQNTLKPQPGKHTYRILPSWRKNGDKQFWHDFGQHFVKTAESGTKPAAVYICSDKTFGKPCDVCAAISKMMTMSDDDLITKRLKEANSTQRYLMNVLHLTGQEPTKVQVFEVGQKVFESICELVAEYNDITDPENGIDIIIKREGSGLETAYTVLPAPKAQKVPASALSQLVDLDDFVSQENPAGEQKALGAVGQIVGIQMPAKPALERPAARPSLQDLSDEAEDLPFDEAPAKHGGKSSVVDPSDEDLDELDALLNDD